MAAQDLVVHMDYHEKSDEKSDEKTQDGDGEAHHYGGFRSKIRLGDSVGELTDEQILQFSNTKLDGVRCCDESNGCCQCLRNCFLYPIGFLFFLFMLVLLLFVSIWHFIKFYLCCNLLGKCCGIMSGASFDQKDLVKDRDYVPYKGGSKCCCRCNRYYFAEWRLSLLLRAEHSRKGCCYTIQDRFVGFYSLLEFLFESLSGGIYYVNDLAQRYGDYFPLLFGIACVSSDIANQEFVETRGNVKEAVILSSPINTTARINSKFISIFKGHSDPEWLKSRRIHFPLFYWYISKMHSKSGEEEIFNYLDRIIPENSVISMSDFKKKIMIAFFYALFGGELNDEEASTMSYYSGLGALWHMFPSWMHFILCGYRFENKYRDMVETMQGYFIRLMKNNRSHPYFVSLVKVCKEEEITLSDAFKSNTMALMIVSAAVVNLCVKSLEYLREDPNGNVVLWNENAYNFLKEVERLNTSPTRFTHLLKKARQVNIGGKKFTLPEGTPLEVMTSIHNYNRNIFGMDADKFNPKRQNLDKIQSWNGPEYFYKEGMNSSLLNDNLPRYCMGHDFSLWISKWVVERHMPLINTDEEDVDESKQVKLGTYATCIVKLITPGVKEWNVKNKYIKIPEIDKNNKDFDKNEYEYPIKLSKVELFDGTFELIKKDEDLERDWAKDTLFGIFGVEFLFPIEDDPSTFKDENECKLWSDAQLAIPNPNVEWNDLTNDESVSLFAFAGLGSHYTKMVSNVEDLNGTHREVPDGTRFVSDFRALSKYPVRKGLERYGACAYFDENYKILGVYVSYLDKLVLKNDEDELLWHHSKYIWTTSVVTLVTIIDHLGHVHLVESNTLLINTRENVPLTHPLRRLLKIFCFRTSYINQSIFKILLAERGLVHRIWGFTYDGIEEAIKDMKDTYEYKPIHELHDKSMNNVPNDVFPIKQDTFDLYQIMRQFISDYVYIYYKSEEEFTNDKYVTNFYDKMVNDLKLNKKYENYTKTMENFINMVAGIACSVVCYHEYVGSAFDIVSVNTGWHDTKIYKKLGQAKNNISKNEWALAAVLVMLTGVRNPLLINDFTHLLLKDEKIEQTTQCFEKWQNELKQLAKIIDERNKNRRIAFNAANPRVLECSVSI